MLIGNDSGKSVAGKTVFLTGASRGIGAAAAEQFVRAGAKVALIARSQNEIDALAVKLGDQAIAIAADISDMDALRTAVLQAEEKLGPIDILINNAAVLQPIARLTESAPEDWAKLIDINIMGVYYAMRLIVPSMIERGGGTVLTVSSGAAQTPYEGWSAYCTSKAGAAMLTKMLHHENAADGIRAMGLSPGTVATQMQCEIKRSGVNPVSTLAWDDHVPADWPARALLWMCGEQADPYLGEELKLRDAAFREALGLE